MLLYDAAIAKILPRNLVYAWSQHESLWLAAFSVNKVTHWWTSQENLLCIYAGNRSSGKKTEIREKQVMTRMNEMNWVWNNRTEFLFIPGQYPVHYWTVKLYQRIKNTIFSEKWNLTNILSIVTGAVQCSLALIDWPIYDSCGCWGTLSSGKKEAVILYWLWSIFLTSAEDRVHTYKPFQGSQKTAWMPGVIHCYHQEQHLFFWTLTEDFKE